MLYFIYVEKSCCVSVFYLFFCFFFKYLKILHKLQENNIHYHSLDICINVITEQQEVSIQQCYISHLTIFIIFNKCNNFIDY